MAGIDFIGDVHGHADALEALLWKMGYRRSAGAWRHPSRRAFFLGDWVDRGPEQLRGVRVVREMVEAGSADAVMGNHELNACAIWAADPRRPGETLRKTSGAKGARNLSQHEAFLSALGGDEAARKDLLSFFAQLPLWVEAEGFVAVHACWDERSARLVENALGGAVIGWENMALAAGEPLPGEDGSVWNAVEILCKGMEADIPEAAGYLDSDGHPRSKTRIKWWDASATTLKAAAIVPESSRGALPEAPLPEWQLSASAPEKPVFFGHYWMRGTPELASNRACCLDWSVAKGGKACAYRWDGEADLRAEGLCWVGSGG